MLQNILKRTIRSLDQKKSRQLNKLKTNDINNFSDQNYNFFAKNIITKLPRKAIKVNHRHKTTTNNPRNKFPTQFISTVYNETADDSENIPFFHQNENLTNRNFTRNQPHSSEGEDYFNQDQQRF